MKPHEAFEAYVNSLGVEQASALQQYLGSGRAAKHVDNHVVTLSNPMLVCPVCECSVREDNDLLLVFGASGFRKKARFCGYDCLEFFLSERKRLKQKPFLEEEHATQ